MYTKPIETKEDAIAFLQTLVNEGQSIHPDDYFECESIRTAGGKLLFTAEEVKVVKAQMPKCHALLDDVYETELDMVIIKDVPQ